MRVVVFPAMLLLVFCCLFATGAAGLLPESETEIDTQLAIQPEEKSTRTVSTGMDDRLRQDKIIITPLTYRQIFEPYLNSDRPVFITADTVLSAYHVLLTESMDRYAQVNARRLPEILKLLWRQIAPEKEPAAQKGDLQRRGSRSKKRAPKADDAPNYREVKLQAEKRARIVIAVAMKLTGDDSIRVDQSLKTVVEAEVQRINRAKGLQRPKWIGEPDFEYKGIDYSRFQPHGFYAQSEQLEGYYRAMRWLQSIPFRIHKVRLTDHRSDETAGDIPPGFVEPEPEFFARLYDLVERTAEIFERCGAFLAPRHVFAQDLRVFAGLIQNERFPHPAGQKPDFTLREQSVVERAMMVLSALDNVRYSKKEYTLQRREIVTRILSFADALEEGIYEDEPTYHALVIETHVDLKHLWQTLGNMCRRLEVMAHKQLRGVAFNDRETYFLDDIGRRLAAVMRYGAVHRPKDDAPAILVFYANIRKRGYLHGAVARPRELLVMYPFQGREILCRGAVLPYFEFVSGKLLSDREWLKRLDSDERPASPAWLKPILAPGAVRSGRPAEGNQQ